MKMKITLVVLMLCLCFFRTKAQITFQDNAPCLTGGTSSGNFIDWRTQTFNIYTKSLGRRTIESPFYNPSLTNPNINEFSRLFFSQTTEHNPLYNNPLRRYLFLSICLSH